MVGLKFYVPTTMSLLQVLLRTAVTPVFGVFET